VRAVRLFHKIVVLLSEVWKAQSLTHKTGKDKGKGKLVPVHVTKVHKGVEKQLQSFLISALYEGKLHCLFVEQNPKTSHRRHVFSCWFKDIKSYCPLATAATPETKEYFLYVRIVNFTRLLSRYKLFTLPSSTTTNRFKTHAMLLSRPPDKFVCPPFCCQ
jgi:hypothetical protein